MVIDTKIMRFMKAAKVICSKNTVNKITGIAYNNQMIVATNCNVIHLMKIEKILYICLSKLLIIL